jgi:hypothetical protein
VIRFGKWLTTPLAFTTVVFLIPVGRESEYIFGSQKGLLSIAKSAHFARLIAVAFGRHSTFESQEFVQNELNYVIQVLLRQGIFLPSKLKLGDNIPFMVSDGTGSRNVLAKGEMTMLGEYSVKQVQVGEQWLRRLYFMDNPFVIQLEVSMETDEVVDKSILAIDYHKSIFAGVAALATGLQPQDGENTNNSSACLIGLGGGEVGELYTTYPAKHSSHYGGTGSFGGSSGRSILWI